LFGAIDPTGDPSLNLWILGWDLQTLSRHPGWLLNGRVFNAPIFFPALRTLAYSDHLLLQSLIVWPIYAVTHNLVVCYNLLLMASLVASAMAMQPAMFGLTNPPVATSAPKAVPVLGMMHSSHALPSTVFV
jgi:hypothetical protein